jgi:hypothetical protein
MTEMDAEDSRDAEHAPDCNHDCGGDYVCNRCERKFGWCLGAFDDTPAICDECANLVTLS